MIRLSFLQLQLDSPQWTSAVDYVESCLSSVYEGCYTSASVYPCYCSTISGYVDSQNDCFATGNSIAQTTLWDQWTGTDATLYLSELTDACSDLYTLSSYTFPSNPAITTHHATVTPTPIFEPVTISVVSSIPTTTYPTQSIYSGGGNLLAGYCSDPEYTLVAAGASVWWAPIVGCHSDKPDCCPSSSTSDVSASTFTSEVASTAPTVTVTIGPSQSGDFGAGNAAMEKCPADYQTVSGGCCPS
jgi:hypothetical protein